LPDDRAEREEHVVPVECGAGGGGEQEPAGAVAAQAAARAPGLSLC
jgi:hypothetical protein